MTKNLLAAELARILPHAEYVEMLPNIKSVVPSFHKIASRFFLFDGS